MAMPLGRVLTSGVGIGTSTSSANSSLVLFKNCVMPSYPYVANLTSPSLSLKRISCLPEPKDAVGSTDGENKDQVPEPSSKPKSKSKSRRSGRRGTKGKKKDTDIVKEVEAEKDVPVPTPVQSVPTSVQSSQSANILNLEDVNPVGLGRRSRQIFDDVWRKFSGLGQIPGPPPSPPPIWRRPYLYVDPCVTSLFLRPRIPLSW